MILVCHYSVTYVRGDRDLPDIRVASGNAKLYYWKVPSVCSRSYSICAHRVGVMQLLISEMCHLTYMYEKKHCFLD